MQFIHRWKYDEPTKLLEELDFTVCQAAVWWANDSWQSLCSTSFYPDLAARRLVYTFPQREEESGGSMMRVRKFLGRPVNALSLVGGGGSSAVWCQIFADTLGVEVRQVKDPIQANARGAAWIAAAGLGEISFSDVPALVELEHVFVPRQEHLAVYDERYRTFLEIHKRMRPLFRRINKGAQ